MTQPPYPPPPPEGPYPSGQPQGAPYPSGQPHPAGPPQGGPYQSGPPQVPTAGQPADMVTRFVAKVIDWIIVGLGMAVVFAVLRVASFGIGMRGYLWETFTTILSAAVMIGYFSYLESSRGQSFGKSIMNIRVESLAGGPPSLEQAVKRNIYFAFSVLGIIPLLGGVLSGLAGLVVLLTVALTINSDTPAHRGWHDKFADTRVIKSA